MGVRAQKAIDFSVIDGGGAFLEVCVPRISSGALTRGFRPCRITARMARGPVVPLSRLLPDAQLIGLRRRDTNDLAIEVVVLRHERAVLRRQLARPALHPADRTLSN